MFSANTGLSQIVTVQSVASARAGTSVTTDSTSDNMMKLEEYEVISSVIR